MDVFEKVKTCLSSWKMGRKAEKNPLLSTYFSSLLSLVLCTAMFLGTTMAWFTSEVSNTGNEIYIGTLDVEMQKLDKSSTQESWLSLSETTTVGEEIKNTNQLFDGNIRWEPGYTSLETVKITNTGDLAFNYEVFFTDGKIDNDVEADLADIAKHFTVWVYRWEDDNAPDTDTDFEQMVQQDGWEAVKKGNDVATLADILTDGISILQSAITDVRGEAVTGGETQTTPGPNDAKNTSHTYTIALHMSDEATGRELMGRKLSLSVKLVAYQKAEEDNAYDTILAVNNAKELDEALKTGGNVVLISDVMIGESLRVPEDVSVKLDLNGHSIRYTQVEAQAGALLVNDGKLTICGKGRLEFTAVNPATGSNPSYASNTISNRGELTVGAAVVIENKSEGTASYAVDNHGTFSLNGGELISASTGVRVANYAGKEPVFVMNAGLIRANKPVIIQLPGSNAETAPVYNVTVNGGKIVTAKASSDANDIFYTYSHGNSFDNVTVTINGGEFLGGTVSFGAGAKNGKETVNITGGSFEYDVLRWLEGGNSELVYEKNLS